VTVRVLIAVSGAREVPVAAALGAARGIDVARRCADLSEAVAAASAGVGSVVVLSEQASLDRGVLGEFAAAGVAVVGAPAGPDAAEQLRSLGLRDLIPHDADADAVVAIVERVAQSLPEAIPLVPPAVQQSHGSEGMVVAVWGPAGAPGRTTVALNLAYELGPLCGALLVDADTYGGAVGQAIGLADEAPGLAAVARASLMGTLGTEVVTRHTVAAGKGLQVLTGITRSDRWPELPAAALDPLWDVARQMAPVTVVDVGFSLERDEVLQYDTRAPQRNGATLSALAAADLVVAVGAADPLGMQRLVHGLQALDEVAHSDATPRLVVVNKVRASVTGPRPRQAVADLLRRYAGVERTWVVPWDQPGCDAATLTGQALAERVPRSPARRAIQALAQEIVSGAAFARGDQRAASPAPYRGATLEP